MFAQITRGRYRLVEIQARYNQLCEKIAQRYPHGLKITLSDVASEDSVGKNMTLPFGCRCINGVPEVALFVPAIRMVFEDFHKSSPRNFRQVFESCVIIGFLHELDHLALRIIGDEADLAKVINGERIVWAETCEQAVRLFLDIYIEPLCWSDMLYYSAWVRCRRNVESKQWKDFIASLYGSLRRNSRG